jgi:hypothetical protein
MAIRSDSDPKALRQHATILRLLIYLIVISLAMLWAASNDLMTAHNEL